MPSNKSSGTAKNQTAVIAKSEPTEQLQTAVLFIVFNRPETTAQVFEAIRNAQPPRLYVAADGARLMREGEAEIVAEVRKIATAVDWPCDVKTLFRDRNLGCKYAVSGAISWFFSQEEQGIILEDDCLPHPDFFSYCEWGLGEFRDVHNIWHLSGNNFSAPAELYVGKSIGFCGLAQVWGWATWANRWKEAQLNPFYLADLSRTSCERWSLTKVGRTIKWKHLMMLMEGFNTWDYQWQISVMNAEGLAASPVSNLISNLGDGPDATHTQFDQRARLQTQGLDSLEYGPVESNLALTCWYENKMGLNNKKKYVVLTTQNFLYVLKEWVKKWARKIVFGSPLPVVVASTGRCGSTLLAHAIAASRFKKRLGLLPASLRTFFQELAVAYLDRMPNIAKASAPVLKTHDLYQKAFSDKAKFIFIFGDPLEAAQSVAQMEEKHGLIWVEKHIYHLQGNGTPHDLFHKDILNYENQIRLWSQAEGAFLVHFDELWDKSAQLSEFLGFDVTLPERRKRSTKPEPQKYDRGLFDRLKTLETELRSKIV